MPRSLPPTRATFSLCDLAWLLSLSELPFSHPPSSSGATCSNSFPCPVSILGSPPDVNTTAMRSTPPGPAPGLWGPVGHSCRPCVCWAQVGPRLPWPLVPHPHAAKIRSSKRFARQTPEECFQGGLLTSSHSVSKPWFSRRICDVPGGLENQVDTAPLPRRVPVPRVRRTSTHSGAMLRTRSPKRVQQRSPAQTPGSGWRPWGPPGDRPGAREPARASLSPGPLLTLSAGFSSCHSQP